MRAELKYFDSPDIVMTSYQPDDPKCFSFLLEAFVGPEGQDSSESFGIHVCTPQWLDLQCVQRGGIFGRHLLIVAEFDLDKIKEMVTAYCSRCEGADWDSIAKQIARIGFWEFEDYKM